MRKFSHSIYFYIIFSFLISILIGFPIILSKNHDENRGEIIQEVWLKWLIIIGTWRKSARTIMKKFGHFLLLLRNGYNDRYSNISETKRFA